MTLDELKALKVGTAVRMGKYHWIMEGYNSLKEPVFHRVDDATVKLLDTVFIPHLITLADEGYEYEPPKPVKTETSKPSEEVDEIQIQQPKKRGRPRKVK